MIWVDNQSTIKLAKYSEIHKRTKHIDVKFYYVRGKIANHEAKVQYSQSEYQGANILTKLLPRIRFGKMCEFLGLISLTEYSNDERVE